MKKLYFFLAFLICCAAQVQSVWSVPLTEVVGDPYTFDKKKISIEGEVIGEPLKAEAGTWINISSQANTIAVFIANREMIQPLQHWGKYRERGDTVRLYGIFQHHCPLHHKMDFHAEALEVIVEGEALYEIPSPLKIQLTKISLSIS